MSVHDLLMLTAEHQQIMDTDLRREVGRSGWAGQAYRHSVGRTGGYLVTEFGVTRIDDRTIVAELGVDGDVESWPQVIRDALAAPGAPALTTTSLDDEQAFLVPKGFLAYHLGGVQLEFSRSATVSRVTGRSHVLGAWGYRQPTTPPWMAPHVRQLFGAIRQVLEQPATDP